VSSSATHSARPSAAYWRRTLRAVAGPGRRVALAFTDGSGRARRAEVELAGLDDPGGPLVVWEGERRRLCPWDALTGVEAAQ
jgi:hypothetical protein